MITSELNWSSFDDRYQQGEEPASIFGDMILDEARRLGTSRPLTLLDIGCGEGFNNNPHIQEAIAAQAGRYIGVEPDTAMEPNPLFQSVHRCFFEDAPIEPGSVDIAFAVMVLEHLESPAVFWDKLHSVLREGGIFWGFTIDSRNWFASASTFAKRLRVTDWYLNRLHGKRGEDRYANYPVFYRSNSPEQIASLGRGFRSTNVLNFHRMGQLDYYFPHRLRWLGRTIDRATRKRGRPGVLMAVRAQK